MTCLASQQELQPQQRIEATYVPVEVHLNCVLRVKIFEGLETGPRFSDGSCLPIRLLQVNFGEVHSHLSKEKSNDLGHPIEVWIIPGVQARLFGLPTPVDNCACEVDQGISTPVALKKKESSLCNLLHLPIPCRVLGKLVVVLGIALSLAGENPKTWQGRGHTGISDVGSTAVKYNVDEYN